MSAHERARLQFCRLAVGVVFVCGGVASVQAQQQDGEPSENASPLGTEANGSSADSAVISHAPDTNTTRDGATQPGAPTDEDRAHRDEHNASGSRSSGHIAPPPPREPMEPMDAHEMTRVMEMDDSAPFAMLKLDRFERDEGDNSAATAWKLAAWIGGDFDKVLLRSEGEHTRGEIDHADAEVLWDHAVASFWDTQVGVRHDFGVAPDRNWAAFGVQGLAPYWFDIEATAYAGDAGRTALRIEVDYDVSLTQRLILQPRVELNAYGKTDPAARIGSGLSDVEVGLRLRYEIRREIAPYIGIERVRRFGATASFVESDGMDAGDTRWVVGVRVWY